MRFEYEEIHKNISKFITCQDSNEGRKVDLLKIKQFYKEILFTDWDTQLKQAERAATTLVGARSSIIKVINENLHSANLVKECIRGSLPNIKQLEQ